MISKEISDLLRNYLIVNYSSQQKEMGLLDSSLSKKDLTDFSIFTNLLGNNSNVESFKEVSARWSSVTTNSLISLEILGMETRLGLGKKFTVGVVYSKSNQTEGEMFLNKESPLFLRFLSIIGQRIQIKNWEAFAGKFKFDRSNPPLESSSFFALNLLYFPLESSSLIFLTKKTFERFQQRDLLHLLSWF